MNFLYTCLSAKITNKFKSKNTKLHKSLYEETGKLGELNMWVYKTGPYSYTLEGRVFQKKAQSYICIYNEVFMSLCHTIDCHQSEDGPPMSHTQML